MNKTIRQLVSGNAENHMLPFFWQHGEDEETLRKMMKVIRESGCKSVCIESRPHPDFCGEKWWTDMDIILPHFVNYMSRFQSTRGMKKTLYFNHDGSGQYVWKKDDLIDLTFPQVLDAVTEEFPDQIAFKYTTLDYTRTYSEFRDDVDTFARALVAMGVKAGSKVSIVLQPESLGRVSVEIMNTKDGIVATITTDTQQVTELFKSAKISCYQFNKFDVVMAFFFENEIYDLNIINTTLYILDLPMLGYYFV